MENLPHALITKVSTFLVQGLFTVLRCEGFLQSCVGLLGLREILTDLMIGKFH